MSKKPIVWGNLEGLACPICESSDLEGFGLDYRCKICGYLGSFGQEDWNPKRNESISEYMKEDL